MEIASTLLAPLTPWFMAWSAVAAAVVGGVIGGVEGFYVYKLKRQPPWPPLTF